MTRAELLALAARVEAAQGPDPLLDGEIWRTLNGWREEDGARFSHGVWWRRTADVVAFECPPRLTSSLDTAAALEGDGWCVTIEKEAGRVVALVSAPNGEGWRHVRSQAATEPQARTAAALRAMAEEAGE